MKTTDIFTINRSSRRLNETMEKTFGRKLNLETFDLAQLEDARNKLRTQIHTVRAESGFNENLDNDAFHQAQWMLDAINSEIAERQEFVSTPQPVEEGGNAEVAAVLGRIADEEDFDKLYDLFGDTGPVGEYLQDMINDITGETGLHPKDDFERIEGIVMDRIQQDFGGQNDDEGGDTDDAYALASAGHGSDEDYESVNNEAYINNSRDAVNILADLRKQSKMAELGQGEPVRPNQLVNDLWDVIQWIEDNMKESMETESKNTGDDMRNLREGEIQQASAIVTAKTMVDRVGRWIEELSGMENDTLLTLGDSIRDEMGAEAAKSFISSCAPAIQAALDNLKQTREALSTSVRALTGEEQAADMLGGDEGGAPDDFGGEAEPDMMNTGGEEPPMDDFAASEPGVGGMETAGREQRESINYQNRLMKVLAG
jgi:hypothetical protein